MFERIIIAYKRCINNAKSPEDIIKYFVNCEYEADNGILTVYAKDTGEVIEVFSYRVDFFDNYHFKIIRI